MAIFENFPYTNIHELNLDWVIKIIKDLGLKVDDLDLKIDDLEDVINNKIDDYVKEYIKDNLDNFLLGAMYIPERTCIKLQPAEVIGGGDHVYNSGRQQILVLEGR